MPPVSAVTRDQTQSPGMCADLESNPQPASSQDHAPTSWVTGQGPLPSLLFPVTHTGSLLRLCSLKRIALLSTGCISHSKALSHDAECCATEIIRNYKPLLPEAGWSCPSPFKLPGHCSLSLQPSQDQSAPLLRPSMLLFHRP